MKITDKDRKIISSLLKMSSETFSMNCCNDIQDDIQGLFNQQERDEFNKKLADYNNSPDDYEPGEEYIYGGDWFLMEYYADMILQNGGKIMDVTKEDMRKVVEIITEIIGGRASGGKILELEEKFCPPPTIFTTPKSTANG